MAWRPEMDLYVFGQRLMTNLGIVLGNGMAYYAVTTLKHDLDSCSYGHPGNRAILFASFNGDVTSCRNGEQERFRTYPTGGDSETQSWMSMFMIVQITLSVLMVLTDGVQYRLRMLSPVTFVSLIQTVTNWLLVPCYGWMLALAGHGFLVTCHAWRSGWKGTFSALNSYKTVEGCQEIFLYKWNQGGGGFSSYLQYAPFNLFFLLTLGLSLGMLFQVLNCALLLPQTVRWVNKFKESYHLSLHPIFRIRRPGEEDDF